MRVQECTTQHPCFPSRQQKLKLKRRFSKSNQRCVTYLLPTHWNWKQYSFFIFKIIFVRGTKKCLHTLFLLTVFYDKFVKYKKHINILTVPTEICPRRSPCWIWRKSLDMKYMEIRQKCISSHFSRSFDVKMTSTDTLIRFSAYKCQQPSTTITFQAILRMFH